MLNSFCIREDLESFIEALKKSIQLVVIVYRIEQILDLEGNGHMSFTLGRTGLP